jgi:hypothetical protein
MSTVTESVQFSNIGAVNTATFKLKGGKYAVVTKSTGAGTIDFKILGPDGSTYLAVITQVVATTGFANADLPPGQYRVEIGGFTANYISVTSVPY